ncbi:hypothetical protein [Amycolatopsis acidicola]|uniref:hypothetical protein n=1 Tax=Amycolatopsis acidicola TaxID=2596893 RepID=UPI001FB766D3|nr:hypothetical protein [Amycolatopsis acidicola]
MLQLVSWQLAVLAVVLGLGQRWAVFGTVVGCALLVVGCTAVRVRGRWLYEWLILAVKYALRHYEDDLRDPSGSGRALVKVLSPEAVSLVHNVGDEPVFMLSRITGITAVLRPDDGVRELAVPAPEVLLPPHEESFTAQVIHHAGLGQDRPLRTWIALQAMRTIDVYTDTEVRQTLGNALRRVRRRLHRSGLPTETLPENEFFGTLASLAHVTADRGRVREDWRFFYSGPVSQAVFRLGDWSRLSAAASPQLLRRLLTATPYAAVTIAVSACRSVDAEPEVDAALRLAAADPAALEHAATVLTQVAGEWAVTMTRLDGRHGHGLAITLPLGLQVSGD